MSTTMPASIWISTGPVNPEGESSESALMERRRITPSPLSDFQKVVEAEIDFIFSV